MTHEEWRAVIGYDGLYEVSSTGRIRSLYWRATRRSQPKILADRRDGAGYARVTLVRDGMHADRRVHRLVAEAFSLGDGPVVRHLDGNKTNNAITNLRLGSHAENNADTLRTGSHPFASRDRCSRGHIYTTETTYIAPCQTGVRHCKVCRALRHEEKRSEL